MTTPRTVRQFRTFIVRPALKYLRLWSEASENLIVGTALVESGLDAFDQWLGPGDDTLGPAFGLFQIEPPTHADVLDRLRLRYPEIEARLVSMAAPWPAERDRQLVTNLAYAAGVARCKYYLDPRPLPAAWDVEGLGAYHVRVYNAGGKATVARFVECYRALAA